MTTAYSYTRLSTEKQLKGHGATRQFEAIDMACKQHGWTLSEQTFSDLGVSAWKGSNATTGALSQFIELAKNGAIAPDSVLIVESIDRLSRQQVDKSLRLLLEMLDVGVRIYTLSDSKLYESNAQSVMVDLLIWLTTAQRAHEESETKSMRVRAAKQKNKELIRQGIIVTRKCPEWLTVSDDMSHFIINEERASIVREVFTLYSQGYSTKPIALKLNERGVPYWGTTTVWSYRHIRSLLKHRGVIGDIQLLKRVNGRDEPDGEPVSDYYPVIVDKGLYAQCQKIKKSKTTATGRVPNAGMVNLFRGLLKCQCGSGLAINSSTVKGNTYRHLRCSQLRTTGCDAKNWHYGKTEKIILIALRNLNWSQLHDDTQSAVHDAEQRCALLASELQTKRQEAIGAAKALVVNPSSKLLSELLEEAEADTHKLEVALKAAEEDVASLRYRQSSAVDELEELQSLLEDVANDVDARHKVNGLLRRSVDSITFGQSDSYRFQSFLGFEQYEAHGLIRVTLNDGTTIDVETLKGYLQSFAWNGDEYTEIELTQVSNHGNQPYETSQAQKLMSVGGQLIDLFDDEDWVSSH